MRRVLGLLLSLSGTAVWASPTSLNTVPTTDIVPVHQITLSLQNGNTSLSSDPTLFDEPQPLVQSQLGFFGNLEAGADLVPAHPPNDYRPQFNAKWRMLAEDYNRPALAAGTQQIGSGFSPSYYLVVTRTLNYSQIQYQKFRAHHRNIKLRGRRVHAGLIHGQGHTLPMLGTDWEMSDLFVLYADWISGSANAVTLGGVYVINTDNSIQAAIYYGNQQQRINGLLLNYSRSLKW